MDRPSPAGGRRQGGGERGGLRPRTAAPTALQTGLQFLVKDLLRFWMVDIRREGHGETQGAGTHPGAGGDWGWVRGGQKAPHLTGTGRNWDWDHGREKPRAPGESVPIKLLAT